MTKGGYQSRCSHICEIHKTINKLIYISHCEKRRVLLYTIKIVNEPTQLLTGHSCPHPLLVVELDGWKEEVSIGMQQQYSEQHISNCMYQNLQVTKFTNELENAQPRVVNAITWFQEQAWGQEDKLLHEKAAHLE